MRFFYIADEKYEETLKRRPKRHHFERRRQYIIAVIRWRIQVFFAYLGSDRGL
jgi:hypothetical protein